MEAVGWQGPKLEKKKNALGDYGGSIGDGGFGNMFKTPRKYKTKVYKTGSSILKTNVRALNKEFKLKMKANKRKYNKRGTEAGYYSKARIAERKELAKKRKEEQAMRKLNAPVKQKRSNKRKQPAHVRFDKFGNPFVVKRARAKKATHIHFD